MPAIFLHALILIAAVFALYRPSLDYGFVWDDQIYVVQNPAVQDWSYAAEAFTSPATTWSANAEYNLAAWRPLRNISYLIDHSLYGLNPMGYHLTNILLHGIAAVLLYLLILRLVQLCRHDNDAAPAELTAKRTSLAALAGAAFWAVHPVQTEVVAWIKSRDDLLGTCFFFAALLLALRTRDNITTEVDATDNQQASALQNSATALTDRRCGFFVAPGILSAIFSVLLFVCALLSKENTIILAAVYPIILFLISLRPSSSLRLCVKHFLLPSLPLVLTFAATAVVYLAIQYALLGRTAQASYPGDTPLQTILTMLHAFTRYIQLIVWPWPPTMQSADYDAYPIITSPTNLRAISGLIVLLFLLLLLFASLRLRVKNFSQDSRPIRRGIHPLRPIGIALFLLALLPYANLIPMMQILAERFLYLPLAGIAIILSFILLFLSCFCSSSRLCAFASNFLAFIFIAALATQTHHRLPAWQSELTLFTATRAANPVSWRPADLYIKALLTDQQTTAAVQAANAALRQFPNDPDIVRTAAVTHLITGHETTGTQLTHYAVQLQPNDFRASRTLEQWRRMQK